MSRITQFEQCIARPSETNKTFYLTEHLEGVRDKTRSFFTNKMSVTEQLLLELAAISHDIGKAHHEWQRYIQEKSSRGPNHAECGAMFFAYLAYHYLQKNNLWEKYKLLWLYITRDIADHHSALKGFAKNEAISLGSFERMDMCGIESWVYSMYPELEESGIVITEESLDCWQFDDYKPLVKDTIFAMYAQERETEKTVDEMMDILQQWRTFTSMFIAADRFDIENIADNRFSHKNWQQIDHDIKHFCAGGKHHPLATIRSNAQISIINQWRQKKGQSFYVLEMPTGYGKTVTALKLASEIAKESNLSKIIYVAPYLSILEQNARAIEKSMKHIPLEHHSMSLLKEKEKEEKEKLIDENEKTDEMSDLHVQAWANEVVCTSFVQWMKAIFPSRAQETLRRIYLQNSIIIIDEPQIINAAVWNLFLKGLESMSRLYNQTIIFCSATMPPFTHGLTDEPKKLTVSSDRSLNRYQIKIIEPIDALECVDKLPELDEVSSAVIVNTIHDAIEVYRHLPECDNTKRYLLHGLMIPMHKKIQLKKIEIALEQQRDNLSTKRLQVVSTQIIEAGADLSFHYMYRALPILPSLTQAAGRVNRHGEKSIGTVETGMFLRKGEDTRFIYDPNLCRISDELLFKKVLWMEEEMEELIKTFYQHMFDENSYESVLQDVKKAMEGNWESLSRHEVFDNKEYFRLPIFIPFNWKQDEKLLADGLKMLMGDFKISSATDIYEIFKDKQKQRSWSYNDKKKFNILFNQFVLNVPANKAFKLATKEDFLRYKIPILEDDGSYDLEKGLAFMEDEIENSFV